MTRDRRHRLSKWLGQCLPSEETIATYILWQQDRPIYAGCSDISLRRRLVERTKVSPDSHFTFDVARSPKMAFDIECSLFYALDGEVVNVRQPRYLPRTVTVCPFCQGTLMQILDSRLPEVLQK